MVLEIHPMTCLNRFFPKRETLNRAVEWVSHLHYKRQVSVSHLDPNIGYPDWHIRWLQSLQTIFRMKTQIYGHFLPHSFHFTN